MGLNEKGARTGHLLLEIVVAQAAKPSATTVYLTPPILCCPSAFLDAEGRAFVSPCALLGCQDFVKSPVHPPLHLAVHPEIRFRGSKSSNASAGLGTTGWSRAHSLDMEEARRAELAQPWATPRLIGPLKDGAL
jgi:hypothetical protein